MSQIHTIKVSSPVSNSANGSNSIQLESNDAEISTIVQKIGKNEIKIENDYDKTIINNLIDHISTLQNDKKNLMGFVANMNEEFRQLNDEISKLTKEKQNLLNEQKIERQVFNEHKEDFMEAITKSASLVDDDQNTLGNILNDNEINTLKNNIQDQTLQNYKNEITKRASELKLIETQINEAKSELTRRSTELSSIKSLEAEISKLKNEIIEERESNFKIVSKKTKTIHEQEELIGQQIEMMQLMENDIARLETIINDMDSQLHNKTDDADALIEQLKIREMEIAKAREVRARSTSVILYRINSIASNFTNLSLKSPTISPKYINEAFKFAGQSTTSVHRSSIGTNYSDDGSSVVKSPQSNPHGSANKSVRFGGAGQGVASKPGLSPIASVNAQFEEWGASSPSNKPQNSGNSNDNENDGGNDNTPQSNFSFNAKSVGFRSIEFVSQPNSVDGIALSNLSLNNYVSVDDPNLVMLGNDYNDKSSNNNYEKTIEEMQQQINQLKLVSNEKENELDKLTKQLVNEENSNNVLKNEMSKLKEQIDELNEEIIELKQPSVTTEMIINGETESLLSNNRERKTTDTQQTSCVMFGFRVW